MAIIVIAANESKPYYYKNIEDSCSFYPSSKFLSVDFYKNNIYTLYGVQILILIGTHRLFY